MIRTTALKGTPSRRIAVIAMPRPQRARLGTINDGWPPTAGVSTTMAVSEPDSSDNWLAYKLLEQAHARETTPGTLLYTPAPTTPAPIVAPWNSWGLYNCDAGQLAAVPDPQPAGSLATFFMLATVGVIGTVAVSRFMARGGR